MKRIHPFWLFPAFGLGWIISRIYLYWPDMKRDFNRYAYIFWRPLDKGQLIPKIKYLQSDEKPSAGSKRILHDNHPGGPNPVSLDIEALKLIRAGKTKFEAWDDLVSSHYPEQAREDEILIANERRQYLRRINRKLQQGNTKTPPHQF
jgi:hypothetical protein